MVDSRSVEYEIRAKDEFSQSLKELAKVIRDINKDSDDVVKGFEKQSQAVAFLSGEIKKLEAVQNELIRKARLGEALEKNRRALRANAEEGRKLKNEINKLNAELDKTNQPTREQRRQLADLERQYKRVQDALVRNRKALVDSRQEARRSKLDVNNLAAEWRRFDQAAKDSRQEMNRLKRTLQDVRTGTIRVGEAAVRTSRGLLGMARSGRQSLSIMQRIRGEVIALATAYIGLQGAARGVQGIFETQRVIDAAQARFRVGFGGSDQQAQDELRFVREEADRLGLSFTVLAQEYSKFIASSSNGSLSLAQQKNIFTAVAEAATVNRLSVDDLAGVYRAFTQIVSKGQVQAEELRGQLGDRLVGAVVDFANGLGITTTELNKMLEQGQITSEALNDFANELADKYGTELANAIESPVAKFNRLQNAITDIQVEIAASGFIDELVQDLDDLSDTLSSAEFREGARALGRALGGLIRVLVLVVENFEELGTILAVIVASKVLINLANGFVALRAAMTGAATAGGALAAVGAAATGPAGWITLAIVAAGAAAVAFSDFSDESERLGDTLRRNREDIQRFRNPALLRENQLQGDEVAARLEEIRQQTANLQEARERLSGTRRRGDPTRGQAQLNEIDAQLAELRQQAIEFQRIRAAIIAEEFEETSINFFESEGVPDPGEISTFVAPLAKELNDVVRKAERDLDTLLDQARARNAETLAERQAAIVSGYDDVLDGITRAETELNRRLAQLRDLAGNENLDPVQLDLVNAEIDNTLAKLTTLSNFRVGLDQFLDVAQVQEVSKFIGEELQDIAQTVNRNIKRNTEDTVEEIRRLYANLLAEVGDQASAEDLQLIDESRADAVTRFTQDRVKEISQEIVRGAKVTVDITVEEIKNKFAALRAELGADADPVDLQIISDAEDDSLLKITSRLQKEINDEIRLRNTLIENVRNSNADTISQQEQIAAIEKERNANIRDLVAQAQEFAGAEGINDPQLIADLEAILLGLENLQEVAIVTGAEINQALAGGAADALEEWVDGTKSAREAFSDFARDFLKDIARMITQQAILNALQGGGGASGGIGGAISGAVNALFRHDGGMVGPYGPSRMVPAIAFAGAPRFHSGSVVPGLMADEFPAILQSGEEVLSRTDPRNKMNGGMSPSVVINVETQDAQSFRRSEGQIFSDMQLALEAAGRRNN